MGDLIVTSSLAGGAIWEDANGRTLVLVVELVDVRRLSLWLFFTGEPSMTRTHPAESVELSFLSTSTSKLCLWNCLPEAFAFASALLEIEDEALEAELFPLGRPVRLPIRSRGTRV
jgi:hypothetical protein